MSPERRKSLAALVARWLPSAFSGVSAASLFWFGGILSRVDHHLAHSLTVEDGVAWERQAAQDNPTIKWPNIFAIHAANVDADEKTFLKR